MGTTPAAVTQYLEKLRGETAVKLVESSDDALKIVSNIANGLAKDEASVYDVLENICRACRAMMSKGFLCEMHKETLPALKESEVCECRCPIHSSP